MPDVSDVKLVDDHPISVPFRVLAGLLHCTYDAESLLEMEDGEDDPAIDTVRELRRETELLIAAEAWGNPKEGQSVV